MDITKDDKTYSRRATAIRASGFYLRMQIASCVLGSPKCFGRPKTTCSGYAAGDGLPPKSEALMKAKSPTANVQ
jgi:hypothetical protein